MLDSLLKARAYVDWVELKEKVADWKSDINNLYAYLRGHNEHFLGQYENKFFDVNYKSICATIRLKDGKLMVDNYIEVWDDIDLGMVCDCHAESLVHYVNEEEE